MHTESCLEHCMHGDYVKCLLLDFVNEVNYVHDLDLCECSKLCEWCEICEGCELDELYALYGICALCEHKERWVCGYIFVNDNVGVSWWFKINEEWCKKLLYDKCCWFMKLCIMWYLNSYHTILEFVVS